MIVINIKGKNVDNYINRLSKNKIQLYKIKKINQNETNITINEKDLKHILENKSIYEINIINYKGISKIKNTLKNNIINIFILLFGFLFLLVLTNTIFEVEVIYNDEEVRNLIKTELRLYDIEKYKFVKSFEKIENIKKTILEKYKEKIEWLEINRIGTKYEIRLELRKLPEINNDKNTYNIVAKKEGIIKKIEAQSGEKIKNINDYVKKGDIIISSDISLNSEIKGKNTAKGSVFAEVWYQVNVDYPFVYKEEIITGKTKTTYSINFLNKSYSLFDFKPFQNKKITKTNIINNNFIPLSFTKQKEEEIILIDEINTVEEATNKAINLAQKRIEESLSNKEYVISNKVLSSQIKDSKIECVVFFTVYEDITEYKIVEDISND